MSKNDSSTVSTHHRALRQAYQLMRQRFGHQHWWPGETPFEVCVGAILTQNNNWGNVERAIANLKAAEVLEPARLHALAETELARLIRPAGYFNVKARRLRSFLEVLVGEFGGKLERLFAGNTAVVRARLLAIKGIGPETADSMLLYAGGHLSFVVDAYTKRIFQRHGWSCGSPQSAGRSPQRGGASGSSGPAEEFSYDALKALCETTLAHLPKLRRLDYWQDYHAQLVMVGKHCCRPREPRCASCPLQPLLPNPASAAAPKALPAA